MTAVHAKFLLRGYQEDIMLRVIEAWRKGHSVLVQMPTGTGKTHVLAALVNEQLKNNNEKLEGGAVWIVAHRRELVEQIEETVRLFVMHNAQFIMHNRPAQEFVSQSLMHNAQCIMHNEQLTINNDGASVVEDVPVRVYSIQWLSRHWGDVGNERPGLIVIDEAHHALAETYKELWRRYPEARFLGMTATPCRLNRRGFTDLFDTLVTVDGVAEFIRQGWLSAFDYVSIRTGSEEQRLISSLKKRGADGDYQVKEMDAVLNRRPGIGRLYDSVRQYADGRKGIVYAISISHARNIAEYYNNKGINAVAIDSKTPAKERKRLVDDFRQGRIQVLVNVDVFSEGFDCPDVEFIQLARPTLSLAKYLQQVGRGLRRTEAKETCVIIDNVGLYRLFGLPTAYRDWQAMFEGRLAGKGCTGVMRGTVGMAAVREKAEAINGNDAMEVVVTHERLLELIDGGAAGREADDEALRPFKDRATGLYGLRRGEVITVMPQYGEVFDVRDGIAAVRFADLSTGVVDGDGRIRLRLGRNEGMRILADGILAVADNDGPDFYIDLKNARRYKKKPMVVKLGGAELLSVDGIYYSRTKQAYRSVARITRRDIILRDYYLLIYDKASLGDFKCGRAAGFPDTQACVCLLDGDEDDYYRFCERLEDGSIIIADRRGRYYQAERGKKKKRVACDATDDGRGDVCSVLPVLRSKAFERAERSRKAKLRTENKKREERLAGLQGAVPFRSGTKYGLKLGDKVIVPPIYRNIQAPVGCYCAFEDGPCRWGVIRLDGLIMIEPGYSRIEIADNGTATLTTVPGKTKTVKLKT